MATNFCPRCGTPRDPARKTCEKCSFLFEPGPATPAVARYDDVRQLPGYVPPPVLPWLAACPNCGRANPENKKTCPQCQYKFPQNTAPRGPRALAYTRSLLPGAPPVAPARSGRSRLWLIIGGLVAFLCVVGWLGSRGGSTPSANAPTLPAKTPGEQLYVDGIGQQTTDLHTALASLTAHLNAPATAPQSRIAPYQEAMTHFDNAMVLLTQEIDGRDSATIRQGSVEMQAATARIADATAALDTFNATHR